MATKSKKAATGVVGGVVLAAGLATALLLGGEHTAAPKPIRTPVLGAVYSGYVSQAVNWDASSEATGYRLYLNGVLIAINPPRTSALLAVQCGVQQRFNSQPFNNKGLAPLAPPLYFTTPCP